MTETATKQRTLLTKDQILDAKDIVTQELEVPEWGGWVTIKTLNGRERADWQQATAMGSGVDVTVNFREMTIKLVALSVIDPATGQRMFSDADARALARKSSAALERIANAAMRLSGIGDDEMAALGKGSNRPDQDDDEPIS